LDSGEKKMTRPHVSLSFSDLSAGYDGVPALKGLSGAFQPGCVTALIGPNGSGKSTLLKALAGILPYEGSAALEGRELKDISRRQLGRLLGILAQRSSAKAAFTAFEVIGFGRIPYKPLLGRLSQEDEKLIRHAAELLDVTELLARTVTELSGGELQRVFLAMIAAQDPPVLLLDEPTSAMDPRQAAHAFRLMRTWAEAGKTVVTAVHDINTALRCADCYFAVKDGRCVSSGAVSAMNSSVLRALYDTPFSVYISSEGDHAWLPQF
jgi:ABC-type cobalamin/Fe3+-siderophores transport system ATPase subunit